MNYFSLFLSKSSFPKNVRQLSIQKFFSKSLIMSCASRKEHVYIAITLSYITKQHLLLYLKAKNSLNREKVCVDIILAHRIFYNVQRHGSLKAYSMYM